MRRSDVLSALEAMRFAGLEDFGRWPKDDKGLVAMTAVWHNRLAAHNVTLQELQSQAAEYCEGHRKFPALADFLDGILDRRPLFRDPVIVGSENGIDRYGERENYLPGQYRELPEPIFEPETVANPMLKELPVKRA